MSAAGRPASVPNSLPSWRSTGSGQEMPFSGEVVHQAEKERQIVGVDALFVERQDEGAGGGVEEEIRVFRTLGDALVGEQPSRRIFLQEGLELAFGNVGIDAMRVTVDEGHVGPGEFDVAQRAHDREVFRLGGGDRQDPPSRRSAREKRR